jgi:DCN1-like protein 4/5
MLEFCRTVKPTLHDYEADGVCLVLFHVCVPLMSFQAWPTLLDDFVAWKKAKLGNGAAE